MFIKKIDSCHAEFVMIYTMNYYSYSAFKKIVDKLKKSIVGCKINNITVINSHDFLCSLSMIKNDKLLISLNHQRPFLSLINVKESAPTIVGKLNESLRKLLKDAYIVDISLVNHDRIVLFKMQKANDYYEKIQFNVYLECIPQRANLVFVNQDNLIIHALHYSPLTTARPILNNLAYELPSHSELQQEEESPSLQEIRQVSEKYYLDALSVHKKEKFTPLYRYIKTRIKSLNKKCVVLEKEIAEAKSHLKDVEHGNALLAYLSEPDLLKQYVQDNNLLLNKDIGIVDNANQLFKKYKKSKRTIEMAQLEILKAQEESDYLSYLLASSKYMNDDELLSLSMELLPKQSQKKKSLPIKYGMITYQNVKILYGKNASSNAELTFKVANKNDYYLHIKDYHGAHVIIKDNNPSNDVKLVAAELCLILSNKSAGEVMITEMHNVKKGHALGEATLLNYSTITLNTVREETKELLLK